MAESVEAFKIRMAALCDQIRSDKALYNDSSRPALMHFIERLKVLLDVAV